MKKTYIEPNIEEINVSFEAALTAGSPDETPGGDGVGTTSLDEYDEGLAKEDFFGW
ncbi:MAG: hypothetical protein Q4F34_07465 [Prevotellaceae bacterium]|nr:hypothetical protein [Prevotellaceae bacterium]